jgi:hypothetical protein
MGKNDDRVWVYWVRIERGSPVIHSGLADRAGMSQRGATYVNVIVKESTGRAETFLFGDLYATEAKAVEACQREAWKIVRKVAHWLPGVRALCEEERDGRH